MNRIGRICYEEQMNLSVLSKNVFLDKESMQELPMAYPLFGRMMQRRTDRVYC